MTDERSLWEQATESSYFAARKEERPDPPPEPLPETLPEPRPGEPTWRPGAAAPAPAPRAVPDFLDRNELAFDQISRREMDVFDADGQLVARIRRARHREERAFLSPRVLVVEDEAGREFLHIRDLRGMGGASFDAFLPGEEERLVYIVGMWKLFRMGLSIQLHAEGVEPAGLLADGDRSCRFVEIFPDVGQPDKGGDPVPPVASLSRERMGFFNSLSSLYRFRLRMDSRLSREVRLAMVAAAYVVGAVSFEENSRT